MAATHVTDRADLEEALRHLDAAAALAGADHRAIDIQRTQLESQRAAVAARGQRTTPAHAQPLAG